MATDTNLALWVQSLSRYPQDACCICYDSLNEQQPENPSGIILGHQAGQTVHLFHKCCLDQYQQECPTCRVPLRERFVSYDTAQALPVIQTVAPDASQEALQAVLSQATSLTLLWIIHQGSKEQLSALLDFLSSPGTTIAAQVLDALLHNVEKPVLEDFSIKVFSDPSIKIESDTHMTFCVKVACEKDRWQLIQQRQALPQETLDYLFAHACKKQKMSVLKPFLEGSTPLSSNVVQEAFSQACKTANYTIVFALLVSTKACMCQEWEVMVAEAFSFRNTRKDALLAHIARLPDGLKNQLLLYAVRNDFPAALAILKDRQILIERRVVLEALSCFYCAFPGDAMPIITETILERGL